MKTREEAMLALAESVARAAAQAVIEDSRDYHDHIKWLEWCISASEARLAGAKHELYVFKKELKERGYTPPAMAEASSGEGAEP